MTDPFFPAPEYPIPLTPEEWAAIEAVGWTGDRQVDARDADSKTALMLVCHLKDTDESLVRRLLEAGSDVHAMDAKRLTPVWHCRSMDLRKLLLAWGADLDHAVGDNGMTMLHVKAFFNHPDAMREFLEIGANPWQPDARGRTPVDYALEKHGFDLAALAVEVTRDILDRMSAAANPAPKAPRARI
jgi:ankyrin repeat protein